MNRLIWIFLLLCAALGIGLGVYQGVPSQQERLQRHTHLIYKTTPDGERIPCVVYDGQGIDCKFDEGR